MWKPDARTRETQGPAKRMNFLNVHVDEMMVNIFINLQ
jgi:hypothetical protein